jgi:glucosamine--fructose-6-phosphate aminotransferase (isomerizing)
LVLGIAEDGYIVASDPSAVLAHTREVIYLNDGEMATLTPARHSITNFHNQPITRDPETIEWSVETAQKGGHPHFMHKEIFEQPESLENSIRGRLIPERGLAKLGGLEGKEEILRKTKRLVITACGTSYFAGCVGRYMLEEYTGIPTDVELASELRYRKPLFKEHDILLAISQSGETADTLGALREAKEKGVFSLGLVNVVGSTVARETDAGIYEHAGPEIGVASTKAFTSQVAILALLTLFFGREREMSLTTGKRIAEEIKKLPSLVRDVLKESDRIKAIAEKYAGYENFFYLGRKYNFPVALEGALKIKEIGYVHAEGLGAGEMKHGPIAMIDENFPSVFIAPTDSVYEKTLSNMQEIKARGGPIIAIATKGNEEIESITDDVIYIPKTLEMLTPVLSVIPLQLLAYYVGVGRGLNVDKPRNLAKSVTVE